MEEFYHLRMPRQWASRSSRRRERRRIIGMQLAEQSVAAEDLRSLDASAIDVVDACR
jgi:hypothetical protein